jgi:hypothetical protein
MNSYAARTPPSIRTTAFAAPRSHPAQACSR